MNLGIKHKFNYQCIFNEIYNQQYILKNYNHSIIKCPFCNNEQCTLLPYNDNIDVELIYGINTRDEEYNVLNKNKQKILDSITDKNIYNKKERKKERKKKIIV